MLFPGPHQHLSPELCISMGTSVTRSESALNQLVTVMKAEEAWGLGMCLWGSDRLRAAC